MTLNDLKLLCQQTQAENRWLNVTGSRVKGKRVRLAIHEGPYVEVLDESKGLGRILPEKVLKWLESKELN